MPRNLNIINQSGNASQAIVYQVDPEPARGQYSLVWLWAPLAPGMTGTFSWSEEYSFVWGLMQQLSPGAIFRAIENLPANTDSNAITLSNARQNMKFIDQRAGSLPDNFYIRNAADVPMHTVAEVLGRTTGRCSWWQRRPICRCSSGWRTNTGSPLAISSRVKYWTPA